jgi:hypothetical protein
MSRKLRPLAALATVALIGTGCSIGELARRVRVRELADTVVGTCTPNFTAFS